MTTQYIVEEILRRNIADLEKELQRQKERHAAATARLRDQIERVTSEWERVESAMASAREENERLRKDAVENRTDADRWRFFRSAGNDVTLRMHNSRSDFRDEAIDSARGNK